MRRSVGFAAILVLAAVPAARAQLALSTTSYMISNEPPYRDQGGYGTCWTFAAMASIETNIIQEGLPGYDAAAGLSECDLAWNSGFLSQIGGGMAGIQNGGNYLMAAAYLARGAGPLTDAQAPYSAMANYTPTGQMAPYYVRDIEWYHTVADIKTAVMTYGAVATCWQTSSSAQLSTWSSALNNTVYYDPGPGVPNSGPGYLNQPDHAVAIVGWNDSVQCPAGGGTGAWIIRNSWGDNTQHFGVSYNDFYTGNDTPDAGALQCGRRFFPQCRAQHVPADLLLQPVRLDRSAALRLRLQPFHRRPDRIAQVGQLLHHRRQRRLHGQRLRAVPERYAGAVGRGSLRHGGLSRASTRSTCPAWCPWR